MGGGGFKKKHGWGPRKAKAKNVLEERSAACARPLYMRSAAERSTQKIERLPIPAKKNGPKRNVTHGLLAAAAARAPRPPAPPGGGRPG